MMTSTIRPMADFILVDVEREDKLNESGLYVKHFQPTLVTTGRVLAMSANAAGQFGNIIGSKIHFSYLAGTKVSDPALPKTFLFVKTSNVIAIDE